jgi:hypothetical protein
MLAIGCDHPLELWLLSLHRLQIERRYIEGDWLEAPGEALKQKETPTEGQGLPVSADHLAQNA